MVPRHGGGLWIDPTWEASDGRDRNLRDRLLHFRHPVDTLETLIGVWHADKPPRTQTWPLMAKIARMLIEQTPDWQESRPAREYVRTRLGSADGDTFLLELMPLPAGALGDWPYPDLFPGGREQYMRELLPRRRDLIRIWAKRHRPRMIFCYGTKYWEHHRQIFPMDDFRIVPFLSDKRPVRLGFGTWRGINVVLTPFFQPDHLPLRVVADLPQFLAPSKT